MTTEQLAAVREAERQLRCEMAVMGLLEKIRLLHAIAGRHDEADTKRQAALMLLGQVCELLDPLEA